MYSSYFIANQYLCISLYLYRSAMSELVCLFKALPVSLCIHPCIYVSVYVSMHPPMYLCICLCICLCLYSSTHVSMYMPMSVCIRPCIYVYASVSMHPPMYLCICLCIYASAHVSMYMPLYLCIRPCIYVSTYVSAYVFMHPPMYLCIYLCIYAGIQSGSLKDTKPQNYCFIQPLDMVDHLAGALLTCSAAESIWMSYVNRIRRFSGEEFIVHPNYIPVIGSSSVRLFSTISRSSNQSVSTSPCLIDLDGLRPAFRQAWSECQTFSQYVRHATIDHENEEIRLLSRLFPAYFLANDHLYLVSLLPGIYPNELDLIQLPVIVSFAFLGASFPV
jgi:hypothetical protein